MDFEVLKAQLSELKKISNETWMHGLENRKLQELQFHDSYRDESERSSLDEKKFKETYGNKKYYGGNQLSQEYIKAWIGKHAKNKLFLDYACGNGSLAIMAANAGAKLAIGIDLSSISVSNAEQKAREAGVSEKTFFLQADAENTKIPEHSIEVIICSGMLHHLDLSYAFPELRRILAPGGRILAIEALDYNPLIKLYRYMTPVMRTDWEKKHILSLKDLRFATKFFQLGEIRYWHIASILYPYMKSLLPFLNEVDGVLTRIPILKLMAWIFTFELIKSSENSTGNENSPAMEIRL